MGTTCFKEILDLIKEDRLRTPTVGRRGILIASESDKGRVINSAAFRRLQQKAQVFPLEPNAAVRTRLTHSIEVSQITARLAHGALVLLVIYAKSARENIPAQVLRKIAEEMGHATS